MHKHAKVLEHPEVRQVEDSLDGANHDANAYSEWLASKGLHVYGVNIRSEVHGNKCRTDESGQQHSYSAGREQGLIFGQALVSLISRGYASTRRSFVTRPTSTHSTTKMFPE